jgi:Carotenoid biosynthesis protein
MTMRDAAARGAAAIVVAAGLAPLLVPGSALPMALGMLGLILFLLAHGGLTYGWRGALGFFACAYPVAFASEALSIATGFPFGSFTHDGPGLQILGVPPTVPIVYGVAGYVAWSIARLVIVGDRAGRLTGPAPHHLLTSDAELELRTFQDAIAAGIEPSGLVTRSTRRRLNGLPHRQSWKAFLRRPRSRMPRSTPWSTHWVTSAQP